MNTDFNHGGMSNEQLRLKTLSLNLQEHDIGFYLPPGACMEGRMRLPKGALIAGTFVGEIMVESGSLIIVGSGQFQGIAEADRIYVEGSVSSVGGYEAHERERAALNPERSVLIGRKLFAASSEARVDAELFAPTFTMTRAKIWGGMHALDQIQRRPLGSAPHGLASGRSGQEQLQTHPNAEGRRTPERSWLKFGGRGS